MNDPNTNNSHAVVEQVYMFDGKRAGSFLEWQVKLCSALSLYNGPIFNVLQKRVQRPSSENTDGATDHPTLDIANQTFFRVLLFTTFGSAFSIV